MNVVKRCRGLFNALIFATAIIIGFPTTILAIDSSTSYRFARDNIMFYDPDACDPSDTSSNIVNITERLASNGDSNQNIVYNAIKDAGVDGISDNLSVIAGMMANIQQESGYDPFMVDSEGRRYGLFQTTVDGLKNAVDDSGLSEFWGKTDVSKEGVEKAVSTEINWLLNDFNRFKENFQEILNDRVSFTTGEKGASSYAELFATGVIRKLDDNGSKIEDAKVQHYVNGVLYRDHQDMWNKKYDTLDIRRDNARSLYRAYNNSSSTNSSNSLDGSSVQSQTTLNTSSGNVVTTASGNYKWTDGWIEEGINNLTKEDVYGKEDLADKDVISAGYTPSRNKIILHSTEGIGIGYNAFGKNDDDKRPATHFIIDLVKKKGIQLLSVDRPSAGTKSNDTTSVQIEIVGYSKTNDDHPEYVLSTFGDDAWDYLAQYLLAINQYTGIPLSSTVDWANLNWSDPQRFESQEQSDSYSGIMGHIHGYGETHLDPGNIWSDVKAALDRTGYVSGRLSSEVQCCLHNTGISVATDTLGGSSGGYTRLKEAVEKYGQYAMQLQIEWGTPWEVVIAQMQQESSVGTAGVAIHGADNNWLGITHEGDMGGYTVTGSDGKVRTFAKFSSVEKSIEAWAGTKVMRSGYYDEAFPYLNPSNYDFHTFLVKMISQYAPASDGNDEGRYVSNVESEINGPIKEKREELGWPSSEEWAKENNIQPGGEHPIGSEGDLESITLSSAAIQCRVSGGGIGNGSIVDTAINLAWPETGHESEIKPEYDAARQALGWETGLWYAQDCGFFVATTIHTAGVDPNFPTGGTSNIATYLSGPGSVLWQKVEASSEADLLPGDVFVITAAQRGNPNGYGHTYIYIGDGKKASASRSTKTAYIGNFSQNELNTYSVYRLIGSGS